MRSIVIIGERYAENLGDGVICQCVEQLARRFAKPDDQIRSIDLSCRLDYQEEYTLPPAKLTDRISDRFFAAAPVRALLKKRMGEAQFVYWSWERRNRRTALQLSKTHPADLVIFAGGELFKDYFLFNMRFFVRAYSKQGSKIWFNACGVDEHNTDYVTMAYRKLLRNPQICRITTRNDPETCSRLIPKAQYRFMPDPAVCAADFFAAGEKKSERCVGLGIMAIDELEEKRAQLLSFWDKLIKSLEQKNISYRLFCNGAPEDEAFLREVASFSAIADDRILPAPQTPQELVSQITSFDAVCAFRMHSVILAYAFEIPFVGFAWDRKISDFAKYAEAENQIVDWEQITAEQIMEKLFSFRVPSSRLAELKEMLYTEFEKRIQSQ